MPKLSVFQTILLAVFGSLAVVGVLIFALVVSNSAGRAVGPVTVWGTLEGSVFQTVLQQVRENDSRLSEVTYVQKDEERFAAELSEALASGTGPDLFILRQDYVVRDAGKVYPILYESVSLTQFRNTFIEAAEPYLGENGVLALPLLADPLVLYWNRDLLAAAGYANPPSYWDEFQGMAQRITKRDDSGRILKSAVSFGEYRNVSHAKDIIAMLILQAGGSITAKDSSGRLVPALVSGAGGSSSQAVESALRFYTEFADPSKAIYSWSRAMAESRSAFAAGDVALYIGFASERGTIARMNPNLNYAVAPMPQTRSSARPLTAARVYAIATARTANNFSGAIVVAPLLASADVSRALSLGYGMPSARRDVLGQSASNDDLFVRQAILSRTWIDPDPAGTDGIFRAMIENVTTGTLRLQEAIQRAHAELEHIVNI